MARSSHIYIINQTYDGSVDIIVGTFTVKHEMITALRKLVARASAFNFKVTRYRDGGVGDEGYEYDTLELLRTDDQ